MSDTNARAPANDAPVQPDQIALGEDSAGNSAEAAAGLENLVEVHEREVAELKDKILRVLAEMENLRRRTEREVADARSFGIASFARDVLGVSDNMRRALEAVPADLRAGADAGVKALLDGIELTERELLKALEKNGVRKFEPTGEKFNPNLHQAMYEVPDESVPAGMVAQVMQPGYMIGERILRPAFVGVSKGGPKTAPTTGETPQS